MSTLVAMMLLTYLLLIALSLAIWSALTMRRVSPPDDRAEPGGRARGGTSVSRGASGGGRDPNDAQSHDAFRGARAQRPLGAGVRPAPAGPSSPASAGHRPPGDPPNAPAAQPTLPFVIERRQPRAEPPVPAPKQTPGAPERPSADAGAARPDDSGATSETLRRVREGDAGTPRRREPSNFEPHARTYEPPEPGDRRRLVPRGPQPGPDAREAGPAAASGSREAAPSRDGIAPGIDTGRSGPSARTAAERHARSGDFGEATQAAGDPGEAMQAAGDPDETKKKEDAFERFLRATQDFER